ncbi:hypothetical protein [Adonisia turfae]|uniref:Uncharacterized protein n=1 Tax=Adonisia turfae CCMR0081 TaxID=2292702 RepID=A0A6M0RD60_9CYAN|nr:hypothetical protein [Adonisia turfae]NEZ54175.1 hypothetical protein [Adonisia turfae CCMR0081]
MFELIYPTITAIQVVAAQPKPADLRNISYIQERDLVELSEVVYLVKIYVDEKPPISNMSWDIYFDNYKLRKYGEFSAGFYIKTVNPNFLSENAGKEIRFSIDGINFHDSGQRIPDTAINLEPEFSFLSSTLPNEVVDLPTQEQALEN